MHPVRRYLPEGINDACCGADSARRAICISPRWCPRKRHTEWARYFSINESAMRSIRLEMPLSDKIAKKRARVKERGDRANVPGRGGGERE